METIRAARGRARQFWRVFDASSVPMVIVNNDRRYVAANVAARLLFRLRLGEFLTRRIDDLTPPHMFWRLQERWTRLIREGTVSGRYDVSFPDGSELQIVYCALANVLPAQHLIVFLPAEWPDDELSGAEGPEAQTPRGRLSPREREVLSLIAAGARTEQIADELTISSATARTHTRNALSKLDAHNRAQAMRDGMLDVPPWSLKPLPSSR
ncbi:MAG TPA: LuxR C-terminal-related transcriptional regulator [Solirubrobacteraceae bacterium]|jgi:DNA-binding CsgD family transcriptional regulator